jgi:N-acyl-D-aspartate/D-glutamate deacylase
MSYDIKITGGTIVDGTGAPGYVGDVGIKDGQIVALGVAEHDADRVIDATGKIVSPGFVDIHTHYDAQIMWDRMLTISPWHGVTTVIMGNCGFGVAPTRPEHRELILETLKIVEGMSYDAMAEGMGKDWPFETFPEYMDVIEKNGTAINVGVLVGHTALRLYVMGEDSVKRAATPEEQDEMVRLMQEAMDIGALGLGTSQSEVHNSFAGNPVPSRLASEMEVQALATPVGAADGTLQVNHGVEDSDLDMMGRFNKNTGSRVTWTALLGGMLGPGSHRPYLDKVAELKEQGMEVSPQVTNRPTFFEFDYENPMIFEMLPPFNELLRDGNRDNRIEAYKKPAFRQHFEGTLLPYMAEWKENAVISHNPLDPSENERPLVEVAAEHGVTPLDYSMDLALETDLKAKFRVAMLNHDQVEVEELLKDKNTVLGLSDAGAHNSQLCDACQATDLLQVWVREKGTLPVEEAVRMLTTRPAEVMGIKDRGKLAEGWPADVVVFDLETVGAGPLQRVYDFPAGADRLVSEASGIEAVIVNGTILREHGEDQIGDDEALPGKLLRHGKA